MSDTVTPQSVRLDPLLRWAGSKRQLRGCLAEYWSSLTFNRYVEAFAGSCSLFFWLGPPKAVLADKNQDLMEVYEVLRERPDELYALASSYRRNRKTYYHLRSLDPESLSPLQRAARFVFLNRFCFNGIYRTNRNGQFNVPFSPRKTGEMPSLGSFRACAQLLRSAVLRATDFGTTLRRARAGDFVYIDPPYATDRRRVFTEYGPRPFGPEDLGRLERHLRSLDSRGIGFVLSYADCAEVRNMRRAWHARTVTVRRNVAGFQNARRRAREVIISNIEVG
jgi:DNA adenine methylase